MEPTIPSNRAVIAAVIAFIAAVSSSTRVHAQDSTAWPCSSDILRDFFLICLQSRHGSIQISINKLDQRQRREQFRRIGQRPPAQNVDQLIDAFVLNRGVYPQRTVIA